MYEPSFPYSSVEGQTTHHHDHPRGSASHDDRCIAPSRTFLQDLSDWTPFYGSGAAHAIHHDDQTPHDDSCLIGNGCIGLGLNPEQSGKGMPFGLLPTSGLDLIGLDQVTPRPDDPMAVEYFQSQPAQIVAQLPTKAYEADMTLVDAASVSMLSQASASQSPATRRQNGSSPDDAATEADACSSCDSQCPGSEGACSAGSCAPCAPCGPCDELTACRDENCDKDVIAPDVAHSAFILHGMTGAAARQQTTDRQNHDHAAMGYHQTLVDSNIDFFNCNHNLSYNQDGSNVYQHCFSSHEVLEQFGQSQHTSQQGFSSPSHTQVFSGGLQDHFGFTTHGHNLGGDIFSLDQAMNQLSPETHFQFGLPMSTQQYYTHATSEAHAQQTSATNVSTDTISALAPTMANSNTMTATYAPTSIADDTSVLTPELSDTTMQETSAETTFLTDPMIDAVTDDDACLQSDVPIQNGLQSQNVYKKEHSMSVQCEEAGTFPSPPNSDAYFSDAQVLDSTQTVDQMNHKGTKVHICQWSGVDENAICGKHFSNPKLLWDHVVEFHVDTLSKTQHGYICEWKGCDRRHRSDDTTKIGFHQKSKIKRHMETHTGSAQDYICHVCGMHLSAQQALDNHMLRHGDLKPHKCTYPGCDYSCRSTTGLTTHIRSKHTKDRRFKCNKCGKTFSDSSNLSKHKRSHSNGRAYVCPKCGSGFNRRDGLCRHAKAVHDMTDEDLLILCPPNPRGGRPKNSAHSTASQRV